MNAYWQLTLAQLRIFARNRQVIFWTLMFPVLFMFMFGYFFSGGTGNALRGYVVDQDQSAESAQLAALFTSPDGLKFEKSAATDGPLDKLKHGDTDMVIVIPKGYGDGLKQAAKNPSQAAVQITAYYDDTNQMKKQIGLLAAGQITDAVSKKLVDYHPVITIKDQGIQALKLKYIDFLVPGIVAMMIMSNNLNGVAGQISSWRERGILRRMQSTTLRSSTFIAAQITARLLLNGMQAVIILLIGNIFFGTQVNGSWLLLLFFVVLGTLAFMSIGFIIAGLAKNPESAGPIAGIISFPLMFLGGVFFPISSMPKVFQPFVNALPISHLSTAFRQIMNVGAGFSQVWGQAALLGAWMVVAFIVASFTFKWE